MSTKFLIILFLSIFWKLTSQTVSTVFIDTIKIVVDNKVIYESNQTKLKFAANNKEFKFTAYDDGIYRLNIKLSTFKSKTDSQLSFSQSEFYINDSLCFVSSTSANNYEDCANTIAEIETLRNWDFNNPNMPEKFKINLYYRLCKLAPLDTNNYPFNYREGMWIGPYKGVEKVTVNYKNDKKNGVATAYYNDGSLFNVNFTNNIADNYGKGYWTSNENEHKSKFTYSIPNIVTQSCNSTEAYNTESFYFSQVKISKNDTTIKTKEVLKHKTLSVYSEKKGTQHDSIKYNIKGEFTALINDSIIMRADDIEVHDFYKKNNDSLHCFYKKAESGIVKIPIKDISKIYYSRDGWTTFGVRSTLLALASAFILSPLISIQKSGFNIERFSKVSLISIGVIPVSISLAIAFSQKKFLLKPDKKSNKIWKIEYDAYE